MALKKTEKIQLYNNLVRARAYDKLFAGLMTRGKLQGFYHRAEGGEAPGVGAFAFVRKDDYVWPHFRGHAVPHMLSMGIDVRPFLAEHLGRENGMCKGLAVYHPYSPENNLYGWCGSVGFLWHVTAGYAMAAKWNGKDQIVMTSVGDGGTNRGLMHEALTVAKKWNLPIVWIVENNGLAIYVPNEDVYDVDIANIARGYGIKAEVIDGQDVLVIADAAKKAVRRAREGKGPTFIECKTQRFYEHDMGIPDLYRNVPRTKEEIAKLRERDPIVVCRDKLLVEHVLTEEMIEEFDEKAQAEVLEAEEFAEAGSRPDPSLINPSMLYAN